MVTDNITPKLNFTNKKMEYTISKGVSSINNTTFLKAQLVNVKELDLRKTAKLLASEGSTASETDITAVLTLLGNRLPQLMAMGYKFNIPGLGTFCPTVSGSITETEWRKARVATLMKETPTLSEAEATSQQATEDFTKAKLTSAMLTLSYKLKKDSEFEQALQNANEWERKSTGTVDEDSTTSESKSSGSEEKEETPDAGA